MTALYTYQLYNSIKLHYSNEKYDYAKFGLNENKFTDESYQARADKFKFEKIWNHFGKYSEAKENLKHLFSSMFLFNPTTWIGDAADDLTKAEAFVVARVKYSENHFYSFKRDMEPIFNAIERSSNGKLGDYLTSDVVVNGQRYQQVPKIVELIPSKSVNPETAIILNFIFKYLPDENTKFQNPLWKSVSLRLNRFKTFMNVPDAELKQIGDYVSTRIGNLNQELK